MWSPVFSLRLWRLLLTRLRLLALSPIPLAARIAGGTLALWPAVVPLRLWRLLLTRLRLLALSTLRFAA